jgi:hypothetical protein
MNIGEKKGVGRPPLPDEMKQTKTVKLQLKDIEALKALCPDEPTTLKKIRRVIQIALLKKAEK